MSRSTAKTSPPMPKAVREAFKALPPQAGALLTEVRTLIFETAAGLDHVGKVDESLKWGQPSYAPHKPRTGSPVRLGLDKERPALFCHCQTTLIGEFRARYGETFDFDGNRALILPPDQPLAAEALSHCIALALTYHQRQR